MSTANGSQRKVLIVEDDAHVAEMFRQMLTHRGYKTMVAHGVKLAVEYLRKEKPDLVLLDVMMAGVNGYEIARFIRREPELFDLPIVMVSVLNQPEEVEAGMRAGATAYLTKPVDMEELLLTVESELSA